MGTTFAIVALVAALAVAEYFVLRRLLLKIVDPRAILNELRGEVDSLLVELNQATERNISLIEDRIRSLSRTLREADKRIGILKREESRRDETLRAYAALGASQARRTGAGDESAGTQTEGQDSEEELRQRVVELYRSGVSSALIARKLKLSRGEVELIVSLQGGEEGP